MTQTGRNNFAVELYLYRDARNGNAPLGNAISVTIYKKSDFSVLQSFNVIRESNVDIALGDGCFTPQDLEFQEHYYRQDNINIPDDPQGYVILTSFCCRNALISNIELFMTNGTPRVGITLTADIPDPALALQNSTPYLGAYPSNGYFCLNSSRSIDLSATDPDGDSLAYELVTPLDTSNSPPPNYNIVVWENGFGLSNVLGNSPPLELDPVTGILTGATANIGVFVFSYIVSEYRNGIKLGEVRRDLQFYSLNCISDIPPEIIEPSQPLYTASTSGDLCQEIIIEDANLTDSIVLVVDYTTPDGIEIVSEPLIPNIRNSTGRLNSRFCWQPDCIDAFENRRVQINITAFSFGCDGDADTLKKSVILIPEPIIEEIEPKIPNLFTPNGDGVNDYFQIPKIIEAACVEELSIMVFNRWGKLVFKTNNPFFKWDGTHNGQPLASGVYYTVVRGNYASEQFEVKSYMTLTR